MLPDIKTKSITDSNIQMNDILKKFLRHNYNEIIPIIKGSSHQSLNQFHTTIYKIELKKVQKTLALKVKLLNSQEKDRERLILQALSEIYHPNILQLQHSFTTIQGNQQYLNLLTDYLPLNLKQCIQSYKLKQKQFPILILKLFAYQLIRGISYLHLHQICHRNINPENILVNNQTFELKLCGFSQSKYIQKGENSINQVNIINYRAPELLLGSRTYDNQIDIWASGCVIAEMFMLSLLFDGNNQDDVFSEIIKRLGTPTIEDLVKMESPIIDLKIPQIKKKPFPNNDIFNFISKMLSYTRRVQAQELLNDQFFAELKSGNIRLNNLELPNIDNFNKLEIEKYTS
ncbi:hypothetical protein pb186bvf_005271 [Paramecium bursaria]